MTSEIKDPEYKQIVGYILENEEFNKIKNIEHHGTNRYNHSLKVSYYSYKIAKSLKLDYKVVARGGLLHDFFISPEEREAKEKFLSTFTHPKKAVIQSKEIFSINSKEEDIIRTHMFPVNLAVPKYAESWVVSFVDKSVGITEFISKYKTKLIYAYNLMGLMIINFIK